MEIALALGAAAVPESTADLNLFLAFVTFDTIVRVVAWWAAEHFDQGGIATGTIWAGII